MCEFNCVLSCECFWFLFHRKVSEVISLNGAMSYDLSPFSFYSVFGFNVMCYTSYAKGAHVTSSTPSSVSTKETKSCDSYNPISNLFFSSETDSKTLHVSSTKEFAFRPLHRSPSNSSVHTQWSRPPPTLPLYESPTMVIRYDCKNS